MTYSTYGGVGRGLHYEMKVLLWEDGNEPTKELLEMNKEK